MNSFWKGVCLTIILFFGFVFIYNILNRTNSASQKQNEYQRQVDIYERQVKKASEQQLETERQLKESARLQEIHKSNAERMEILLDRWEKQADRYDAILDRWQKQANIIK